MFDISIRLFKKSVVWFLYSMSRPAWRTPKAVSTRLWSKMIAIPNVRLDDPPMADKLAVRWRAHAGVARAKF